MSLPYFFARRIAFAGESRFSALILRIASTAVALSVAVIIVATAAVAGFKHTISTKIFGFWGHIHISHFDSNNSFEAIPIDVRTVFYPSLDTVGRIFYRAKTSIPYPCYDAAAGGLAWCKYDHDYTAQTKGGIHHIQVYASKAGIIKTRTDMEGIVLKGVGADYDWKFLSRYIVKGDTLALPPFVAIPKYLKTGDSTHITPDTAVSDRIVISESTARRLNISVGDRFTVHFVKDNAQLIRPFTVQGIYKTGLEEYDRKFALCDLRTIQELNGWSPTKVSGFEVSLDNIADLEPFGNYVYYAGTSSEHYSQTIKEVYPNIFGWLDLQDINEKFISLLMLVIAVINMATALMILILERTTMIGTLKALGARDGSIRTIFLYCAAFITARGLLWGNAIGIGLCLAQQYFKIIRLDEEAYYVTVAPIELNAVTIIAINVGTLAVVLVTLLLPVAYISRISPVRAIRFK